jgi:hypothetical protein
VAVLSLFLAVSLLTSVKPAYAYTVTFKTNPTTVGSITVDGSTTYTNGQTGEYTGTYTISANIPPGYVLVWIMGDQNPGCGGDPSPPGVCVLSSSSMVVGASGWVEATFAAVITFHTSTGTGSITYGQSQSYTDGQTRSEAPPFPVTAQYTANPPDAGHPFVSWTTSGSLSVSGSTSNPTTLTVNGPGTLTANFQSGVNTWTYMVYMAADNSLRDEAKNNLDQMQQIGATSSVNIVVLYDTATSTQFLQMNQGAHSQGANSWTVRNDYPTGTANQNMGLRGTLTTFITWTTAQYTAGHYVLIMWDHSGGAASIGWGEDDHGTGLTLQDFRESLKSAGVRFDIIGFDSCLMGMIETAWLIQKAVVVQGPPQVSAADYLVASEETIPGAGFPYDTILSSLTGNPSMTGSQLASLMVNEYRDKYQTGSSDTTLSAITIDQPGISNLGPLVYDVYNLGKALEDSIGTYRGSISTALSTTERFWWDHGANQRSDYFDLYDYCIKLSAQISDPTIRGYCTSLQSHLSSVVLNSYADGGHPNAHGLSIYLPPLTGSMTSASSMYLDPYDALDFSVGTLWNGLVRAYWSKFDFGVSVTNPPQDVVAGNSVTFSVSATLRSGSCDPVIDGNVVLTVNTLPSNVGTYSFSQNNFCALFPSSPITLTINVSPSSPLTFFWMYVHAQPSNEKLNRVGIFAMNVKPSPEGAVTSTVTTSTQRIFALTATATTYFTSPWSKLDGRMPDAPALAASTNELFLCVRGSDNKIYLRSLTGSGWGAWSPVPGSTPSAPSVAVFNGRLYLAVRGSSGNTIYVNSMDLTSRIWAGWQLLDGRTPDAPALAAASDGSALYLVARGLDNRIYYKRFASSWGAWSPISGSTISAPAAASFSGRLYISARGSSGNTIYVNSMDLTSRIWAGWQLLDGRTPDAPELASDPSALYLIVRGTDNGIYRRSFSLGSWSAWSKLVGSTSSAPTMATYGSRFYFVVRGSDMQSIWQQSQGLSRASHMPVQQSPLAASDSVQVDTLGLLIVFCVMIPLACNSETRRRRSARRACC